MKTILESTPAFLRGTYSALICTILLSATLPGPGTARAQTVTIPDPGLENAVTNQLGIAPPIYATNMLTLTNLDASSRGIENLAGLETASNLLTLNLYGNQVTNIAPLGGLRKLAQLVLAWNRVIDASPVAGLTNLAYLDLGGNRGPLDSSITNVTALTGLKQLQWLSLYYLRVADLTPLTGLTPLTNLDVSWNSSPTNLSVLNGLTNLTLLHVTADNLSNIVFVSHLPLLQDLDFGYNSVHDLSPAVGRNLTSLQAYYNNPLTNATLVTNFPGLAHLSLGGDGLTNASFLGALTNLQELWIDGNPDVASLTPVLGLTNLWHLDVNGDAFTNLAAVAALTNLTYLEMNGVAMPQDFAFVGRLVNLNSLDLGNDHVGSLALLTNLTLIYNLYLNTDFLTDITPLPALFQSGFGYVDLRDNLLDTNATSAAFNVISNLQNNYNVSVDYTPQNISPTLTLWDSPADDCIATGGTAYFAAAASTTSYYPVTYQWQFNGTDLPGQTSDFLQLSGAGTNRAGSYRAIVSDGNGYEASAAAQLYVGDPNCGRTVTIVQQPVNTVAATNEQPQFSVAATTTLTNLYYQWLFNGTNIAGDFFHGDTSDTLVFNSADFTNAGLYQVLVWDDSSNVVASDAVQLKVVDVVSFTDPNLSSQVVSALGFPPGTPVHLTDLDNLSYLNLNGNNLTNLTGLDCARYLYEADLGNNQIKDASPLGWDSTLQYLYLYNCGLEDASFLSSLTNLVNLDLSGNTIHVIPDLHGLAATLTWLQLNGNGPLIYYFRLSSLTNLYSLGLHDDGLSDIAFTAGMTQLQSLDAGGDWPDDPNRNFISDISPLNGKTQLSWLSLSFNQATNIPLVAAFTNLNNLYLSSNHFGNLSFTTNLPNLHELSINYSAVTNLAPLTNHTPLTLLDAGTIATSNFIYVSGLTNLLTLWAGGNHIGTAAFVSNLTSLQTLGLDTDGITNPAPLAALNSTNFNYLNLENNGLTNVSVLATKTNLSSLYLSYNQIYDLTPLSGLTNLQWLSLNANGITNLTPLTNLTRMIWMTMQSNYVQDVSPLGGFTNLFYGLDVSANLITDASPLTNLQALTSLSLWQNRLTTLPPLAGLPSLTSLDLHANQLTNVTGLASLTSLTWLYLYNNNLPSIHPLTNLTQLIYTDVSYNWLDTTPTSAAMADIAVLQSHGTAVNYLPQNSLLLAAPALSATKHFQFNIHSPAGGVLQVSRCSDLHSWASLGSFTNTGGTNLFTDTNAAGAKFFYRAQP